MSNRVITLEEHIATPPVEEAWASLDAEHIDDMTVAGHGGETGQRLVESPARRIEAMDAAGVDVQVLSLTAPGVQGLDSALAVRLARETNDHIAGWVRERPDRFMGFATLPTPDPAASAAELSRAVEELGLVGAMVHGRTRSRTADDPMFEPIWEAAAGLGVPVYLHPQLPQRSVRSALYEGFDETVSLLMAGPLPGWHYETGLQVVRMCVAGVFDRHPHLQLVLGHWGEMVLFFLDRLDRLQRIAGLPNSITEYFQQHVSVTPSGIYSQRYLRWAIEILGVERVMSAMDYPFVNDAAGQKSFLASSGLDDAAQSAIAGGNWERLIAARS